MSWIFGVLGAPLSPDAVLRFSALHPPPLSTFSSARGYLAAGGIEGTCLYGSSSTPDGNPLRWVVAGFGLRTGEDSSARLAAHDWQKFLALPHPELERLDGHFAVLRWQGDEFHCFTDQLGLRPLYVARTPYGTAVSTRMEWLTSLRGTAVFDLPMLGGHWLLFQQMTNGGLLKDIERVGAGGRAVCTPTSFIHSSRPWTPAPADGDSAANYLASVTAVAVLKGEDRSRLSLGLSGGLDSRFLLSVLSSHLGVPIPLHSFGPSGEPDVAIPARIAATLGLKHRQLHDPLPPVDAIIKEMRAYAAATCAIEPASSAMRLRYYPALHREGILALDGAFGEFARRQYLKRLLHLGSGALNNGSPERLFPFLRLYRVEVFSGGAMAEMRRGTLEQISHQWSEMPSWKSIGEETFLDLLTVRTRIPYWASYEQARMDEMIVNYMPFVQPSVLQRAFQLPLQAKKNSRLFKHLLKKHSPALATIPLAKGGTTYPFGANDLTSILWTKAQRAMGKVYTDPLRATLLNMLSGFIRDTARSREVKEFSAYDHARILRLVDGYYAGQTELGGQLDWWLAFELWRQGVGAK